MSDILLTFLAKYKSYLLLIAVAAILSFIGVKSVPGAVFTTAYQVNQIQQTMDARDEILKKELFTRDSVVNDFHRSITARVDSASLKIDLLTAWAAASTRLTCEQLGRTRAESYGYPCREATLHLPR